MDTNQASVPIRPYNTRELCNLYKVSWMTMQKWLSKIEHEIGTKQGHFYSKRQVEIIFEILGHPDAA